MGVFHRLDHVRRMAIYGLEHTKSLYPFYAHWYLGRGLVLLLFGSSGLGAAFAGWSVIAGIVGIIVIVWSVLYIINHWVGCLPSPVPLVGGGQCAICSCITAPLSSCCAGRGPI